MNNNQIINIFIVEASQIICEGLVKIISSEGSRYRVSVFTDIRSMQQNYMFSKVDVILINPSLFLDRLKFFDNLKKDAPNAKWIGVAYAYFDHKLLSEFNEIIYINDFPSSIIRKINTLIKTISEKNDQMESVLSEREIEVLKFLVEGCSNKEIGDKLNISVNTVISHRKNISQKTGIKSVSGLTIYAVINNIISVDNF